jgi:hypothetical protein
VKLTFEALSINIAIWNMALIYPQKKHWQLDCIKARKSEGKWLTLWCFFALIK